MGVDVNTFFGGGGTKNWRITPEGEQALQMQKGTGKELEILRILKQNGSSTLAEISKGINEYDSKKVEFVLKELRSKERIV